VLYFFYLLFVNGIEITISQGMQQGEKGDPRLHGNGGGKIRDLLIRNL